jgi:DNA (cytosine-5)-methyltransferase 1
MPGGSMSRADSPTAISLCAGIGGLDLAVERVFEARPVAYIERDAYAQAVLLERMEAQALGAAPIHFDVRGFDGARYRGLVDLVFGGIPCQPHSTAGKQRRGADERDLINEFLRIVGEVGPRLVCVENVRGFVARDGLGRLLGGLAGLGFDAEWTTVQAAQVGAPHCRQRVFVLAYAHRSRPPIPRQGGELELREEKGGGLQHRPEQSGGELGTAHRPRLEERQPKPVTCAFPAPWPPGPTGDWSGVREDLYPALEPALCGVDDGLPSELDLAMRHRVDRLRCLGNAVVPAQAEVALRHLLGRLA